MTTRLIDVIGLPTPEQARRLVLLLGLAAGARNDNGAGVDPAPQSEKTVHPQAS